MRFSRKIRRGRRSGGLLETNDDDRSGISSPIRPIPSHGVRPGPRDPLASGREAGSPCCLPQPLGPGGGQPLPGSAYLPLAQAAAGPCSTCAITALGVHAVAELARQFRTTAPALSARLYRAKQQLRKKLEELGYEEALSEDF